MIREALERVRERAPLVLCITNYVTVNDCANILLACGASPIMADDAGEVEEIVALSDAVVLNLGTLNERTIHTMRRAGNRANALGKPVILDPVGCGASRLRTETTKDFLEAISFTVLRGNVSEIRALAGCGGATRGVDANVADVVTEENLRSALEFARTLAEKTGAVVAISGALDVIADAQQTACVRNGHPSMTRITGSGCMLSALTGAFVAANPQPLNAVVSAFCAMGVCGEEAVADGSGGNATWRNRILDTMCVLEGEHLEGKANYDIFQGVPASLRGHAG